MRAILLLALALAGCTSDTNVASDLAAPDLSAVNGEFCGGTTQSPCCTAELLSQPCTAGQTCKVASLCGGYYSCDAPTWIRMSACLDLATLSD